MRIVTLVHTDIQGSTRLWEHVPSAMRIALEQHDRLQRSLIETYDGYEIRTEGDAFLIAFDEAKLGLSFCLSLQERLLDSDWPQGLLEQPDACVEEGADGQKLWSGPRVRMGIFEGEVDENIDPVTMRKTFQGQTVHRCIAIASAAHGGQIVTDRDTWTQLKEPTGIGLDLGHQQLPGHSGGLGLIQVQSTRLEQRTFPPLRGQSENRTNIIDFTNSTIGRERELTALVDSLVSGARCQTIVGAPGVGKSRIAKAAALASAHTFRGGTWSFDLASCDTLATLVQKVASGLAIPLRGATDAEQAGQLARALAGRGRALVVFDNVDRCADELASLVPAWLETAPSLFIVATSRKQPSIEQQRMLRLLPLSDESGLQLFVERAAERGTKLSLGDAEREACATIVRELDGIPLAIELAASRVGILNPQRIADRLNQRFRLLQTRHRDDDRQSTLSAALSWSWETLSKDQADCLEALSIFRDGFEQAAAARVLNLDRETLDQRLIELHQQSMIQRTLETKDQRFYLLESVRLFASERLTKSGRKQQLEAAHSEYYGQLGESLYLRAQSTDLATVLVPIQKERANLLEAIEQATQTKPDAAAGAALGLVPLLFTQGPVALGNQIFLQLAADSDRIAEKRRALYLTTLARIRLTLGEKDRSIKAVEQAREAAQSISDPVALAIAVDAQVRLYSAFSESETAAAKVRDGLAHLRDHPMPAYEARLHGAIGNLYYRIGRVEEALEAYESSAQGFAALGMPFNEAQSLGNAGLIHLAHQRFDKAEECFLVCLRQYAQVRNLGEQAQTHGYLGLLALDRGDLESASRHYLESVKTGRAIAKDEPVVVGLGYLGLIAQMRGRVEQALIRFDEALESAHGGSTARVETYFRSYHAGLLAQLNRHDEARISWSRAERLLEGYSDPIARFIMELTRAQAWLKQPQRHDALNELIERARQPDESGVSMHDRNEDVRFAVRILEA